MARGLSQTKTEASQGRRLIYSSFSCYRNHASCLVEFRFFEEPVKVLQGHITCIKIQLRGLIAAEDQLTLWVTGCRIYKEQVKALSFPQNEPCGSVDPAAAYFFSHETSVRSGGEIACLSMTQSYTARLPTNLPTNLPPKFSPPRPCPLFGGERCPELISPPTL